MTFVEGTPSATALGNHRPQRALSRALGEKFSPTGPVLPTRVGLRGPGLLSPGGCGAVRVDGGCTETPGAGLGGGPADPRGACTQHSGVRIPAKIDSKPPSVLTAPPCSPGNTCRPASTGVPVGPPGPRTAFRVRPGAAGVPLCVPGSSWDPGRVGRGPTP